MPTGLYLQTGTMRTDSRSQLNYKSAYPKIEIVSWSRHFERLRETLVLTFYSR